MSIQWRFGGWQEYDTALLVRDPKSPCCTPEIAKTQSAPQDLLKQTLLHPVLSRDLWARVLWHLSVERPDEAGVIEFHDAATMRRRSCRGRGSA